MRYIDAVDDLAREVHYHHSEDVRDGGGLGERPRPAPAVSVARYLFSGAVRFHGDCDLHGTYLKSHIVLKLHGDHYDDIYVISFIALTSHDGTE